jgi:membrane-associated protein
MGVDPALLTELALLGVFLGTVLPFAPAEPALISGGALAAAGELSLALVLVVAVFGSVVCDLITYRSGWVLGPTMLRRLGRRSKLSDAISWAESRLAEGAGIRLTGLRVVPTGGLVVPMVCGVFRMPLRQFLVISVIGSTAFSVRATMLGFIGGWVANDMFIGLTSSLLVALLITVGVTWVTRRHASPKRSSESGVPAQDTASISA